MLEKIEELEAKIVELETHISIINSNKVLGLSFSEVLIVIVTLALVCAAVVPMVLAFMQFRSGEGLKSDLEKFRVDSKAELSKLVHETVDNNSAELLTTLLDEQVSKHFFHQIRHFQSINYYINSMIFSYFSDGQFRNLKEMRQKVSELSLILHQFSSEEAADIHDAIAKILDRDMTSRIGFPKFMFALFMKYCFSNGYITDSAIKLAEEATKKCGHSIYNDDDK